MMIFFLYKFFTFLSLHLPIEISYRIASSLAVFKYYISPRDRRAVLSNLKFILKTEDAQQLVSDAKQVFRNFGKYLVDFFRISLLSQENFLESMKIEGLEHIDQALQKGQGAILLGAHIGNWELAGVSLGFSGYPLSVVALPHKDPSVNRFFNGRRERSGVEVIPSVGVALRGIYKALKKNKAVGLLGDRDFGGGGQRLSFLGSTKVIPAGPAALAKRTGAEIVPVFALRQKDNTHLVKVLEPIESTCDELTLMKKYTKVIEDQIRANPTQWLLFRDFSKE